MPSTDSAISPNSKKRSFSSHSTVSSPRATAGSPMMGIITSTTIRCYSPSSSISTSAFVGASGQPLKTPTCFSVSNLFGEINHPQAASPLLDMASPDDQVTFFSVQQEAEGANTTNETFDRSASMINLLGAGFASRQPSCSPLTSLILHGDGQAQPRGLEHTHPHLPFYTIVANMDHNEEHSPFRRMKGPLVDSHAPTPRSATDKSPVTLTQPEYCDDHSLASDSGAKRRGLDLSGRSDAAMSETSTTQEMRENPDSQHANSYLFSAILSSPETDRTVMRSPETDEEGLHFVQMSQSSAVQIMQGQSAASLTQPPSIVLILPNEADDMLSPSDCAPLHSAEADPSPHKDADDTSQQVVPTHRQVESRVPLPTPPTVARPAQPPVTLREATPADAEGIIALRDSLDMTNATSFVWELEDMRQRIKDRLPLVLVALSADPREDSPTKGADMVVGVSGIDVHGMEKEFPITSIGSRLLGVPRGAEYTFPADYCMCRGLLIHPLFQGAGLGSKLHKGRLKLLAEVAPNVSVILSARGSTIEETLAVISPHLDRSCDGTPDFSKDTLFEFTFQTSQGIVHMVHGKDAGWKFVGVDIADGGPVWLTSTPLSAIVSNYDTKIERTSDAFVLQRQSLLHAPTPH